MAEQLKDQSIEMIDHPAHYGGKDDPYEHIKVLEDKGWNYHIGNATKYLWRAGKKGNDPKKEIEDLKKSIWYTQRYVELLEKQQANQKSK